MVAAAGRPGQVWFWAARQAIAPAGIPSGVGVLGLQPTRLRPSAQKAIHLFDQCLGSLAPGRAIQAEFFGFVVVAVLHSEGGEGLQWQKVLDLNSGLLQQQQESGDVVRRRRSAAQLASSTSGFSRQRAILRSRRAMPASLGSIGLEAVVAVMSPF